MSHGSRGQGGLYSNRGLRQKIEHSELTVAKMDQVRLTLEEGKASLLIQPRKGRFHDRRPEFHPSILIMPPLKLDVGIGKGEE